MVMRDARDIAVEGYPSRWVSCNEGSNANDTPSVDDTIMNWGRTYQHATTWAKENACGNLTFFYKKTTFISCHVIISSLFLILFKL